MSLMVAALLNTNGTFFDRHLRPQVATDGVGTWVLVWEAFLGTESDVFVVTPGTRFDAMTYSASGDNTWVEEPLGATWSRGDTLHLVITLAAANPLGSGEHMLKVSTSNGVPAEKSFSR